MNGLLKSGLLGTQRQMPPVLDDNDPADRLAVQLGEISAEQLLLIRTGMGAILEKAGFKSTPVEALAPAPQESGTAPSPQLATLLAHALAPETINLLPEFVRIMQARGIHFPHGLLPKALDLQHPARRDLLRPVLGDRARWLAPFHDDWNWILESGAADESALPRWERDWNEGTFPVRVRALEQLRENFPDTGRQWLEQVASKEKADQRKKLVEVLQINLSLSDLPFLERLKNDRSEGVKEVARRLLILIPESEIAQRLMALARAVLSASRSSKGELQLQLNLPRGVDSEWDIVGPLPVHLSSAERVLQSTRLLFAAIPPGEWLQEFGCSPDELLAAAAEMRGGELLLDGWLIGVPRFAGVDSQSEAFRLPLWRRCLERWRHQYSTELDSQVTVLFSVMSDAEIDQALRDLLRSVSPQTRMPFVELFTSLNATWSPELSKLYLRVTRQFLQAAADHTVLRWCETLLPAAVGLNLVCVEEALEPWSVNPDQVRSPRMGTLRNFLQRFGEVLKIRQQFLQEAERSVSVANPQSRL